MTRETSLLVAGLCGAGLMLAADYVLYYPSAAAHRTSAHYFRSIDPPGDQLRHSSMALVSDARLFVGGALGPVAGLLYTAGFCGLYGGLAPEEGGTLPAVAVAGLSAMMAVGSGYHVGFAYTGLIAKAFLDAGAAAKGPLEALLRRHQTYMRVMYSLAAVGSAVGSVAYAVCCATRRTAFPLWSVLLVPALSGGAKKLLHKTGAGGLALCGGLTNLWNVCFFAATLCARR